MNVLIIGSGGREHALGWKLRQSPKINNLYFSPGNGGTSSLGRNIELNNRDHRQLIAWIKENHIDLVIIGPDQYLAEGLTDILLKNGIKVFGPIKKAAEIEWSKSFAKRFMVEEGIPTAAFATFTNVKKALAYVKGQKLPIVIKADGLALGKGVIIAGNISEANTALIDMMEKGKYGAAGCSVVIEEYLEGREISIHAFCDGETTVLFPASQDHKRIYDNDKGPNTGGMGTIAPLPWVTPALMKEIDKKIIRPTIAGLNKHNRKFVGVLFPGIMVTKDGPKVIEFNARFGDPETQSYMRLLSTDLLDILIACVEGRLSDVKIKWHNRFACAVVLASGGYPGKYKKGISIRGVDKAGGGEIVLFHAGTKKVKNQFVTNGGRVLNVAATGASLTEALNKAYQAIKKLDFKGMQFRRDIGKKSLFGKR
ncbi:MAG: phosphoribosylamine--glycine ligase [Candidatus Paceibacterota bacterium]